jgi:hypothetical protein
MNSARYYEPTFYEGGELTLIDGMKLIYRHLLAEPLCIT